MPDLRANLISVLRKCCHRKWRSGQLYKGKVRERKKEENGLYTIDLIPENEHGTMFSQKKTWD